MMKRVTLCVMTLTLSVSCATAKTAIENLPMEVSNNAVASVERDGRTLVYSMLGIGSALNWDSITTRAFELDVESGRWREIASVPGKEGRVASSAVGVDGKIYLFGGYTVAESGDEVSAPNVDIYDPATGMWSRGADFPVPVDDSVAGVYRGRWVVFVSGWSMTDNVSDVQIYDTVEDRWMAATPIPGTPVFGHAGGLVGDSIVYCDGAYKGPEGARPRYRPTDECWLGTIDHQDLTTIDWVRIDGHPGLSRYRAAAGPSESDGRIYFSGGTDNPYNINGIGYDGVPSEPVPMTFAWDTETRSWLVIDEAVELATMDHRGLIVVGGRRIVVGGMERGQSVSSRVRVEP